MFYNAVTCNDVTVFVAFSVLFRVFEVNYFNKDFTFRN